MRGFSNSKSGDIVIALAQRIIENRAYLSDIDGLIGDGDHGVNMAKGFSSRDGAAAGRSAVVVETPWRWWAKF